MLPGASDAATERTPCDRLAFVAEATGNTGREVVRALGDGGVRTIAHIRPDSPRIVHSEVLR